MQRLLRGLYEKLMKRTRPSADPPPRASASVVPWRRGRDGRLEVYWVRRSPEMAFMGGWWAFPGGGLDRKRDPAVPVAGRPQGTSEESFTAPLPELTDGQRQTLGPDLVPGLVAAALRELWEEIGLLVTTSEGIVPSEGLRAARRRLLAKEATFAEGLSAEGLELDASPLVFAGRWLTPAFSPVRFDNRFFLLEWPAERPFEPELAVSEIGGGELDRGEWLPPAEALERWQRGEVMTAPPILHVLRVLAEDGPEEGIERLRHPRETHLGPLRWIEFRPGVVMLPLRTRTLLPATRTNTYLLGRDEMALIDPAPTDGAEIERLRRALASARSDHGRHVSQIWLTHHHRDHVGAVKAVQREFSLPVFAHRLAAGPLERAGIRLDGELEDGQRIELGGDPPFPVRVIHTPGHTRGHLAFFDETHGSLVTGDLVAGLGTIVIDPPEGDMSEYLDSLERSAELEPKTLFPAHGPAILEAVEKLHSYREHRLWREEKVLEAWRAGKKTPREMVEDVYDDTPKAAHRIAERQIAAHLERLEALGKLTG